MSKLITVFTVRTTKKLIFYAQPLQSQYVLQIKNKRHEDAYWMITGLNQLVLVIIMVRSENIVAQSQRLCAAGVSGKGLLEIELADHLIIDTTKTSEFWKYNKYEE